MKPRPNIFDHATSELSQDAFLTWLISWADKDYQVVDRSLNACAVSFVQKLLVKDESYEIENVKAGRQESNIDVWALVNNLYFIVIEDKKGSSEHSDQLIRYAAFAKIKYKKSNIKIVLVYFKMEEQGSYGAIEKAGYSLFQRSEMLLILQNYIDSTEKAIQNDIIVDYYENLRSLDRNISSYISIPVNEKWSPHAWQGFYSELQKHFGGNWKYVSNRAGGFMGFWWHWKRSTINGKECDHYLQLEQEKLVFKISVEKESERREIRDFYQKVLFKKEKQVQESDKKIIPYGRIGRYMSVAKLTKDYRQTNDDGLLNLDATVEKLKLMMQLMDDTEAAIKEGYQRGGD